MASIVFMGSFWLLFAHPFVWIAVVMGLGQLICSSDPQKQYERRNHPPRKPLPFYKLLGIAFVIFLPCAVLAHFLFGGI